MPYVQPPSEFVLYEGDEPIGVGTASELAEKLGIDEATIRRATAPSMAARVAEGSRQLIAVRINLRELWSQE